MLYNPDCTDLMRIHPRISPSVQGVAVSGHTLAAILFLEIK